MWRTFGLILVLLVGGVWCGGVAAEDAEGDSSAVEEWGDGGVAVERPFPLAVETEDGARYSGKLVWYDEHVFVLQPKEGEAASVGWDQIDAEKVYRVHQRLLAGDDASGWLALGERLRGYEKGVRWSDAALTRAVRADPSMEDAAQRVRDGGVGDSGQAEQHGVEGEHIHGADDGAGVVGPRVVGATQSDFWGELSAELMASSVEELKAFGAQTGETMGLSLRLHETEQFLFYSDLDADESRYWAKQLETMYRQLCEMFALDETKNIFRGKCLIFVFKHERDYHTFQMTMHQTPSMGSAGMCHGFGNGYVHVAFYRQPDKKRFAHLLVHESVHGFLHRYRSPVHVPSWANEGLAETISKRLVPKSPVYHRRAAWAREELRERGDTGGMFDARHIGAWQYGVAHQLTEFMIEQDRARYAAFINGIKDGLTWEESLDQHYGVELDVLVEAFGKELKIRDLKP